jgi:5-methylcytosine-specific restriction protein A
MTYTVNIADIEQALINLGGQAKAQEIQDEILTTYCGDTIPTNYQGARSFRQTIQRKIEDYCPEAAGFDPAKRDAKFHRIGRGLYRLTSESYFEFISPDELAPSSTYVEGATKTVTINYYERDPKARAACIRHYGAKCLVCDFDFEKKYGPLGKSFIHVHHIVQLAAIKATYTVDPINDLRPVCANCHAMLHRETPPISIERLREICARALEIG